MLQFSVDTVTAELRKAVVNEAMGVEKMGAYYIHETLASEYLKTTLSSTEAALKTALGLTKPEPGSG